MFDGLQWTGVCDKNLSTDEKSLLGQASCKSLGHKFTATTTQTGSLDLA